MANVSSSNGLEKRPKLRFPGFDEPWKKCEFKEFAKVNPKCQSIPEQFYYIDLGSVEDGELSNAKIENALSAPSRAQRLLSCNDVLFQTVRPYQQNNYLFCKERSLPTVASTGYAVFRTKYDVPFLYALIHTGHFLNSVLSRCTGTSFPAVGASDIEDILVSIPSLGEQQKIGELFRLLNSKIRKQKALIESLKKYKRGVNNQILSQIDNSYNCRLGSVCEIVGGGTPDTLHTEYWGNTVEWFTPSEIGKTKYVNNSVRKLSDIGLDNSSAKLLPIGTVLLTTRATLGEMSIAKRECSTNQGFQSLIPHTDRVSSEYLYYMQIIIKPWCEKYASGNTFREISKSALSDCIIPIPDRARQEQIVKLLSSIDMLIGAAESISMSLSKIRHGLMQQLFI